MNHIVAYNEFFNYNHKSENGEYLDQLIIDLDKEFNKEYLKHSFRKHTYSKYDYDDGNIQITVSMYPNKYGRNRYNLYINGKEIYAFEQEKEFVFNYFSKK